MKIGLYITFEPENGRPVTLAKVEDPTLLRAAGLAAIQKADQEIEFMASEDPMLGRLQQQEASRLRSALELVIPGLCNPVCSPVM